VKWNAYGILVEESEERSHFSDLGMGEKKTLKQIIGRGVQMYGLFNFIY
jgi:hypothetical protein